MSDAVKEQSLDKQSNDSETRFSKKYRGVKPRFQINKGAAAAKAAVETEHQP